MPKPAAQLDGSSPCLGCQLGMRMKNGEEWSLKIWDGGGVGEISDVMW